MKVKVFHANNPTFGMGDAPKFPEEFTHVADVELPIISSLPDIYYLNNAQDVAYRLTNHIDTDWTENEEVIVFTDNPRSTSVGDVMQIGNRYWEVAMVGFDEFELPD